jgi:NTE family protein
MLEALDELDLKPHRISGTSIGAVIGAAYASGLTAREIRGQISRMSFPKEGSRVRDLLKKKDLLRWWDFINLDYSGRGLINIGRFLAELEVNIRVTRFENLKIPLKIVAADYWSRDAVVLETGPLIPAIQASMALPGIFKPVVIDDRVLVDGGAVNPVPFNLLMAECDVVIAVDVIGRREQKEALVPNVLDAVFNTIQILEKSIIREQLKQHHPTLYVEPDIQGIRVLDFHRAERVFEQAEPAKVRLKEQLSALMSR